MAEDKVDEQSGNDEPAADDDTEDDGQSYVDRDKIDFDPDDGLLSGTAIDGTSEIPGPHKEPQKQDDGGEAGTTTDESDSDSDEAADG